MNKFLKQLNNDRQNSFIISNNLKYNVLLEYHLLKEYNNQYISIELPRLKSLDYSITNDQLGGNYLTEKHSKIKEKFKKYFNTRDLLLNDIVNNNLIHLFDDLYIPVIDKKIYDLKNIIKQYDRVSFDKSALIVLNQDKNDSYENQDINDIFINKIPTKKYKNVFLIVELSASFNEKNITFVDNIIYKLINDVLEKNGNFIMLNHYYPFIERQQNMIHLFQHIFEKVNLVYFKRLFRIANRIYYVLLNKQTNIKSFQFDQTNTIQIHSNINEDVLRQMYSFMKKIIRYINFQMKLIHYLYQMKLHNNSEYRFIIQRIFLLPSIK